MSTSPPSATPFEGLTPECMLDALESVGLRSDGRLLALGSYENRVWQIGIEDGAPVVVKFYRPERWSEAQIAEEHDFVAELQAEELPVVAPTTIGGRTLFVHAGFRFARAAVRPNFASRAPWNGWGG